MISLFEFPRSLNFLDLHIRIFTGFPSEGRLIPCKLLDVGYPSVSFTAALCYCCYNGLTHEWTGYGKQPRVRMENTVQNGQGSERETIRGIPY